MYVSELICTNVSTAKAETAVANADTREMAMVLVRRANNEYRDKEFILTPCF